jgi:hypothetical protein
MNYRSPKALDDLRDDRVTVPFDLVHSFGNPMSQHVNSGFNAPGFSGAVGDPFRACPLSVKIFAPERWSI